MTTMDYIRREFEAMRRHVNAITQDLTQGQLLWSPPGLANPVGATFLHLLMGEDRLVQEVLKTTSSLWEVGGWQPRLGLTRLPLRGHDWTGIDLTGLQPALLFAYGHDVAAATTAYLEMLTDESLEELVNVYGQEQLRANALLTVVIHSVSHAGEIAALKGLQGQKGRPT